MNGHPLSVLFRAPTVSVGATTFGAEDPCYDGYIADFKADPSTAWTRYKACRTAAGLDIPVHPFKMGAPHADAAAPFGRTPGGIPLDEHGVAQFKFGGPTKIDGATENPYDPGTPEWKAYNAERKYSDQKQMIETGGKVALGLTVLAIAAKFLGVW